MFDSRRRQGATSLPVLLNELELVIQSERQPITLTRSLQTNQVSSSRMAQGAGQKQHGQAPVAPLSALIAPISLIPWGHAHDDIKLCREFADLGVADRRELH